MDQTQTIPLFYDRIEDTLYEFKNDSYIICGDFNLVLDPEIDCYKSYKNINNPKARMRLLEIIENFDLIDVFREQHTDISRYTWRRNRPVKQARLDFF